MFIVLTKMVSSGWSEVSSGPRALFRDGPCGETSEMEQANHDLYVYIVTHQ